MDISWAVNWTHIFEMLLAFVLGGIVGIERDIHGRAAGLRTHMLVCAGSALFTIASVGIAAGDPGRIAAQIVSGIGFLGAGTILKVGFNVRGLTTAACMWMVAAVGMACGLGKLLLAVLTTAFTMMILMLAKLLERRLRRLYSLRISVSTKREDFSAAVLQKIEVENHGFAINSMDVSFAPESGLYCYKFEIDAHTNLSEVSLSSFILAQLREMAPDAAEINVVCLN